MPGGGGVGSAHRQLSSVLFFQVTEGSRRRKDFFPLVTVDVRKTNVEYI